jgi:tetratricopeptide (TPR) repeat protein
MMRLRCTSLAAFAATMLPATLAAQGFGQGPPPRNLQVLPKDMSRQEVVARMRGIAIALGVRCEHCHVSTTGPDGREQNDFAADDKETKKVARGMLRMVMDINEKYLKELRPDLALLHQVSCETCHHGLAKPRTIQAELIEAVNAKGADSAIALYKDLRSRYYGRASYDFGDLGVTLAAQAIAQAAPEKRPAGLALLRMNLEFYPQSAPTWTTLVQMSAAAGDTAAAIEALRKALAIAPNDPQLRRMQSVLKDTTRKSPPR